MNDEARTRCPDRRVATALVLAVIVALLAFALGVVTAGFTDLPSRLPLRAAAGTSVGPGPVVPPAGPVALSPVSTASPSGADPVPEAAFRAMPSVVTVLGPSAQGSGVVWSADGLIVTAAHVLRTDRHLTIAFSDGTQAPAVVRAEDPETDLAVLQVPRTGLVPARFAGGDPRVGDLAVVVGSPLGLTNTVTAGIISGDARTVTISSIGRSLTGLLQTDAPISPGNSGGAVVNRDGEVVGISEAYIPPAEGAVAIGFAIPSPAVRAVVGHLLAAQAGRPVVPGGPGRVASGGRRPRP